MTQEEHDLAYPAHARLRRNMAKVELLQEFLDWLLDVKKEPLLDRDGLPAGGTPVHLAVTTDQGTFPVYTGDSYREALLGEFLGIDPGELEREKRQMLERLEAQR